MNREQLKVLLLKAKALSNHSDFVILGSLAILGTAPVPPARMTMSIDVDAYLKADPLRTGELWKALGQGSPFEDEHGYYLDPVSPNLPSFPEGWERRLIVVDFGEVRAFFVDANDVAVSKYIRGERRDMEWLLSGLRDGLLSIPIIENRLGTANAEEGELPAARKRLAGHRRRLKAGLSAESAASGKAKQT